MSFWGENFFYILILHVYYNITDVFFIVEGGEEKYLAKISLGFAI